MRNIPGRRIIWPQYLDSQRPCRLGRRISKEEAIPLPTIQELIEAAKKLGYEVSVNPTAKYPKTWWDPPGYLIIDSKGQKRIFIIKRLAKIIKELREKKEQLKKQQKKEKSQLASRKKGKRY